MKYRKMQHSKFGLPVTATRCTPKINANFANIARTCYYELRRMASVRRFLTSTATVTLVSAYVSSRIDYSNSLLLLYCI